MSVGRRQLGPLYVTPAALLVLGLFVLPMVLTVWMSLNDWSLFGVRRFIGFDNYSDLASDSQFADALRFTALFTVLSTAITTFAGLGLALLVRSGRRGAGLLRASYFLPVAIGLATASFLWIWMYNPQVGPLGPILGFLGIGDGNIVFLGSTSGALWSVVATTVWKSVGFAMLVFLVGLQAIPRELDEAARVDGASRRDLLRHITLPLLRPTFGLVVVLLTTQNFLVFDQFFLMTRGGPESSTVSAVYHVYNSAFVNFRLGYAAALALVLLVVLLIVNVVQMRWIRTDATGADAGKAA